MNLSRFVASTSGMRKGLVVVAALTSLLLVISTAAALNVGARAPEIGLRDLGGNNIRLAALRGKVAIVDFWASWCVPCREEFPVLARLHASYNAQGLVVVGVSVDRELSNVRDFLRRTPASFTIVHDSAHAVADRYRPATMPTSFIVDRRGVVRFVHAGFRAPDAARMEHEVQTLLAEHP